MERCCVCFGRLPGKPFLAREMMFGFRDEFEYVECTSCGSVQIRRPLSKQELEKYYPQRYYSYAAPKLTKKKRLVSMFGRAMGARLMRLPTSVFSVLVEGFPEGQLLRLFRDAEVDLCDRILDVGCGGGGRLDALGSMGFCSLLGVDPYVRGDSTTLFGAKVLKSTLEEVDGPFDVIMFHHSLEHMAEPSAVLATVASSLSENGVCLVRIPTTSSEAWECYGSDWVELDPPRHVFLPSRNGMVRLAERNGFRIESIIDDSTPLQFQGSELYRRDLPLVRERWPKELRGTEPFSAAQLRSFRRRTACVNREGRGGRAAFVFRLKARARPAEPMERHTAVYL